jgi:hypothetical protein
VLPLSDMVLLRGLPTPQRPAGGPKVYRRAGGANRQARVNRFVEME